MKRETLKPATFKILRGLAVLLFLCPPAWLLLASLWPDNQPLSAAWRSLRAFQPTLGNYITAVTMAPMGRFALNSCLVVALAVPLSLLVASWAAFALNQLSHRLRATVLGLSWAALLAPPTVLWLARFPIFKALGWIDSPWPLVAPALIGGSPFFVLLFFWSFRRLSPELFESAILDGANAWQVWWRVALPASRGVTAGVTILNFVLFWGNFADPLLYLRSEAHMTLPVGLRLLAQLDATRWPVIMAGAVMLTLPVLAVFALGETLRVFTRSAPPRGASQNP
ncbi:MAG: carbohydrate ABC transporter permease [Thermoflexales bacterium]|nr:carbohydrate ABC transporter permease [Thermoflexales bacterium]